MALPVTAKSVQSHAYYWPTIEIIIILTACIFSRYHLVLGILFDIFIIIKKFCGQHALIINIHYRYMKFHCGDYLVAIKTV